MEYHPLSPEFLSLGLLSRSLLFPLTPRVSHHGITVLNIGKVDVILLANTSTQICRVCQDPIKDSVQRPTFQSPFI